MQTRVVTIISFRPSERTERKSKKYSTTPLITCTFFFLTTQFTKRHGFNFKYGQKNHIFSFSLSAKLTNEPSMRKHIIAAVSVRKRGRTSALYRSTDDVVSPQISCSHAAHLMWTQCSLIIYCWVAYVWTPCNHHCVYRCWLLVSSSTWGYFSLKIITLLLENTNI